ncbi:MAG: ImmA/IrrE family metallo-endopeptidase [Ruminococcus sp.]|nr:ImmA/IrrE family metallo-endopeptidase [Ruminococcus sp.]
MLLKNSQANELRSGEAGISVFDGTQWYIVYDDLLPLGRKRFTVAHELGHIFLGHPLVAGFHARTTGGKLPQTENEANVFASRFLAPACVLWGLNVHTAADIAQFCQISAEAAEIRASRMAELYKRNMFLTSPLEKRVYNQFNKFIEQNRLT